MQTSAVLKGLVDRNLIRKRGNIRIKMAVGQGNCAAPASPEPMGHAGSRRAWYQQTSQHLVSALAISDKKHLVLRDNT
jgi:hypothetical protein